MKFSAYSTNPYCPRSSFHSSQFLQEKKERKKETYPGQSFIIIVSGNVTREDGEIESTFDRSRQRRNGFQRRHSKRVRRVTSERSIPRGRERRSGGVGTIG
jgi:hypothetical protein